jgi:hypothetical protein
MPLAHNEPLESRSRNILEMRRAQSMEISISRALLRITDKWAIDLSDFSWLTSWPRFHALGHATCGVALRALRCEAAKMLVFLARCSNPNAVFASCGH